MLQLSDFHLPVINQTTGQLESICLADVEKITKNNRDNTIYHLNGTEYMLVTSLDDYAEHMFHLGLRDFDKSNVVNVYKVKEYDEDLKNVYFDDQRSRFAAVTTIHNKYVKLMVDGFRARKRLHQIDREYLETETTTNKKAKKFLDFFMRKTKNI
ncbi:MULTISPECIES: hypothetical protein [Paenibacillus]|uniref:hypothetical protein n=1 Tax=Paenibacillus TaxID=44249 RepID=UPI001C1FE64F|nr:hypothetical protein [Paenibacillus oleatilyticus]MBU7316058.1 hypothetical protein [Paenibacillus oleatilyticus]GMX64496.1 hypothetical protein Elgi_37650 [Paenibacillus elgii]